MKYLVGFLVVVLLVVHQDNWFWDDATLVFGFMPVGLFYHVCLSLAAGAVWLLAARFAWPREMDIDAPQAKGKGDGA